MPERVAHQRGRLAGIAGHAPQTSPAPGLHPIHGGAGRRHMLFVPTRTAPAEGAAPEAIVDAPRVPPRPMPLTVMLHGSGSEPLRTLQLVEAAAEAAGSAVLLPKSSGYTWDAVLGGFGPDVAELDRLLQEVSRVLPVRADGMAVAGFSDGASYALSLGRVNGDLFGRILAFSPGFMPPGPPTGRPRIFVSHGTADPVLPIDRCSRLLVPALRREGYPVDYREFDGGHLVPPAVAEAAFRTVAGSARPG